MTVAAETGITTHTANGSTTVFPYDFRIDDASEFTQYQNGSIVTTGFSLSGIGSNGGGNVTFTTAPASGTVIVFLRTMPTTRTADYTNGGDFRAETVDAENDRVWLKLQEIEREIDYRTLQFAQSQNRTTGINILPIPATNQVLRWDVDGSLTNDLLENLVTDVEIASTIDRYDSLAALITASPTTSAAYLTSYYSGWAASLAGPKGGHFRHKTGATNAAPTVGSPVSVSTVGTGTQAGYCWDATGAEWVISKHKEYSYRQFGAYGNGVTDDTTSQADIFTFVNARGGKVVGEEGDIYVTTALPALLSDVHFHMNGSRINATLPGGNTYGLRLGPNNSGVRGGKIYVTSTGSPSSQAIYHACISVGEANGEGGTVASPSTYSTVKNWYIEDMELSTSRQFNPVVQVMGNCHDGDIKGITIPDNANCSGIHLDWSDIGPNVSAADIALTRTTFDAGNCYTTHPHDIRISKVNAGNLSVAAVGDRGSSLVRMSGCYRIKLNGIKGDSISYGAVTVTGGDLGFEFAPANIKPLAMKGIKIKHISLENQQANGTAYGLRLDSQADNIYREQFIAGYVPLIDPLMYANMEVAFCEMIGPNSDTMYGLRTINLRGLTVRKSTFKKWTTGTYIDENSHDVDIDGGNDISENRQSGGVIGFGKVRELTTNIKFRKNKIYNNGTDTTADGLYIRRGKNILVDKNDFGELGETTQRFGCYALDDGNAISELKVTNNDCHGSASNAFVMLSSTPTGPLVYRAITQFKGNNCDFSVTPYGGSAYICTETNISPSGRRNGRFLNASSSSAPTTGTWYAGDYISIEKVAGSVPGYNCTASGSFGTLAGLTNAATTSSSAVVTMSLTGKTATSTSNDYTITVNDATNMREGLKISVPAAGITNATIVAISGTTVNLDRPAVTTQSGGALTTAGVIAGEVVSINTGTPISSSIVLSVDGDSVTLDTAASATESARTVTYTTPVFKADAAIAA